MSEVASTKCAAHDGYSADVRIELHSGSRVLYPTHTAANSLTFSEPQAELAGIARLAISIDGVTQESTLRILTQPFPSDRILVEIIKKGDIKCSCS